MPRTRDITPPLLPVDQSEATLSTSLQLAIVAASLSIGGLVGDVFAALVSDTPMNYVPMAAIITVPSALVFGIPAFFALRRFRILTVFSACLIGIGTSILTAKVAGLYSTSVAPWWYFPGIGFISALTTFLLIYWAGLTRSTP